MIDSIAKNWFIGHHSLRLMHLKIYQLTATFEATAPNLSI